MKNFKKKVIFFCPSIEDGGVEKNLINISNNLIKFFDIFIVTANFNKKKYFNKKIKFISPGFNYFDNKSRIIKGIICFLLSLKFIFATNKLIISFQANTLAITISKIINCKIIIRSNASPVYYAQRPLKRVILSFFFKFADKIIVNSDQFKSEFKRYFKVAPVRIYNPVENLKILKKLSNKKVKFNFFDKDKKSLKILTIGRLVYQKDHMTILKAIKILKKKRNIKLCIIGEGELKNNYLNFIKNNSLENNIKVVSFKKNIYPFYKKSDLYILSSIYEGLPNTLLEANTFGLKIFSTDCKTGPREILNKLKYNPFFKIGDYKNLSQKILYLNKYKKKKFNYDKRFDFNLNVIKYKQIINSL